MNLLHRNSFILGDIFSQLEKEIRMGFVSNAELKELKELMDIVFAKHKYGPKASEGKVKPIPTNMTINEMNELPIDKIIALRKDKKSFKPPLKSRKRR